MTDFAVLQNIKGIIYKKNNVTIKNSPRNNY